MTRDLLFSREGDWGVVTLNRPQALNSLTAEMCRAFDQQLRTWAEDDQVRAVLIEGAGEKSFCAGGDIRWLATTAKDDPAQAAAFFRTEYKLNNLIADFAKPYIALMDGICMGGGVGVSGMADRRVVSERTMWAMPECGIGLIPDVGASYMLNQLEGGLGLYLGLTGARLRGGDCVAAGVGTHFVGAEQIDVLRASLLQADLAGDGLVAIDAVLNSAVQPVESGLDASRPDIDRFFGAVQSMAALNASLEADGGDFAAGCLDMMKAGSPTSQVLTIRLLNDAPGTFSQCIAREFQVAAHLMEGPDFLEGVRALIIDKDRNPKWQPSQVEEVSEERIDWYFTEPEGGPLALG